MVNDQMPFVAIIGGIWKLDEDTANEFRNTAQEIGGALATAGMGLVVYFSDGASLEPHIVTGYVKALPPGVGDKSIRVRFADSQKGIVKFAEQTTHGYLFDLNLFPGQDWESPFYRSLVNAEGVDAVLLMGGATSTLIAGQIALARPLPTLAIDKYDGSAAVIRRELAIGDPNYPSSSTHSITQSITWLRNQIEERARKQEEQMEKLEEIKQRADKYSQGVSQTERTIWASIAFVGLMITVVFGVAKTPTPSSYLCLMSAGLLAAGATGALVRSIIWGAEETSPSRSLLLGSVAGFVVGLAYLIPQFIGAPSVLKSSATVVEATDKIQFISSILVSISAGVGFDTVFTRLKKEAESQPVRPPNP